RSAPRSRRSPPRSRGSRSRVGGALRGQHRSVSRRPCGRRVYHRRVVEILFLCTRRPELSHAAYLAHLRERHAPLALRHHGPLRGYAVHEVEESLPGAPPLDSINALTFDSLADFATRLYDSPEGERLVTEDHARFLGGAAGYAGTRRVHRQADDLG